MFCCGKAEDVDECHSVQSQPHHPPCYYDISNDLTNKIRNPTRDFPIFKISNVVYESHIHHKRRGLIHSFDPPKKSKPVTEKVAERQLAEEDARFQKFTNDKIFEIDLVADILATSHILKERKKATDKELGDISELGVVKAFDKQSMLPKAIFNPNEFQIQMAKKL